MLKLITVFKLTIVFCCLLAPTFAGAQQLLPDTNPQLFTQAVHILGGNRNLSVRWENDVRFLVVGREKTHIVAHVDNLFNELSELTGISSRRIDNPLHSDSDYLKSLVQSPRYTIANCKLFASNDCPNFVIVLTSQKRMHDFANTIPLRPVFQRATAGNKPLYCFFSPGISSQKEIKQGFVFVDDSMDRNMLKTCLQEEIYQSFGMFNDYTNSTFFSFNNVVSPKFITRYDRALLTSLYDRQFPAGTRVNQIALHMINAELAARRSLLAQAP